MKISSKGKVTIPFLIRKEFGFKTGTDVEFVVEGGKAVLRVRRPRQNFVEDWLDEATGVARGKTTTAKIMKLTRGQT
jgi:AbrB family looped-hinge helix DNA binding protein